MAEETVAEKGEHRSKSMIFQQISKKVQTRIEE